MPYEEWQKIATNQAEIINQGNIVSKNIKGFESIDGVCSQKKYELSTSVIDEPSIDAMDEEEFEDLESE